MSLGIVLLLFFKSLIAELIGVDFHVIRPPEVRDEFVTEFLDRRTGPSDVGSEEIFRRSVWDGQRVNPQILVALGGNQ